MNLLDLLFKKNRQPKQAEQYFQTLTAYTPRFTSWNGALYESELVRAAIDARARHISKLKVEGTPFRQPNDFQTWGQFLYRLSTILDMQNTAFITPVFDERMHIVGIYPLLPSNCTLVQSEGDIWIRYQFRSGHTAAARLSETGIMTKFQYEDDFFGEDNAALNDTMALIALQRQGVAEAIKNGATYRFMAQVNNFTKAEDLAKERKRFTRKNLESDDENSGILLFPNTYTNIKQIEANSYTVPTEELTYIRDNIERYFGINEKVIKNQAIGDELDAFFNGSIEPFAIQLSDVLTRMLKVNILVSSNRLQYMSTTAKISMARDLGDRGVLLIDEIRELFNYPPLPDGDGQHAPIRGEYYMIDEGKNDDNTDI